jgi:hypothetical protein
VKCPSATLTSKAERGSIKAECGVVAWPLAHHSAIVARRQHADDLFSAINVLAKQIASVASGAFRSSLRSLLQSIVNF